MPHVPKENQAETLSEVEDLFLDKVAHAFAHIARWIVMQEENLSKNENTVVDGQNLLVEGRVDSGHKPSREDALRASRRL